MRFVFREIRPHAPFIAKKLALLVPAELFVVFFEEVGGDAAEGLLHQRTGREERDYLVLEVGVGFEHGGCGGELFAKAQEFAADAGVYS